MQVPCSCISKYLQHIGVARTCYYTIFTKCIQLTIYVLTWELVIYKEKPNLSFILCMCFYCGRWLFIWMAQINIMLLTLTDFDKTMLQELWFSIANKLQSNAQDNCHYYSNTQIEDTSIFWKASWFSQTWQICYDWLITLANVVLFNYVLF